MANSTIGVICTGLWKRYQSKEVDLIHGKELKASVIKFLSSERQKLNDEDQYKIKLSDYERRQSGTARATIDAFGSDGKARLAIRYRKLKQLEGREAGANGQERQYNLSDIYKEIAEEGIAAKISVKSLSYCVKSQLHLNKGESDMYCIYPAPLIKPVFCNAAQKKQQ